MRGTGYIDKNSAIPIYLQLKELLLKEIRKAEIGERLPSDRELMRHYSIAYMTVKRAMMDLEKEGYIIRQLGKGTFVASREVMEHHERKAGVNGSVLLAYPNHVSVQNAQILYCCENQAVKHGLRLSTYRIHADTDYTALQTYVDSHEDLKGIMVIPPSSLELAHLHTLNSLGVRVVCFLDWDGFRGFDQIWSVDINVAGIGELAANELIRQGHSKIAYIGNEPAGPYGELMEAGICKAFGRAGIGYANALFTHGRTKPWQDTLEPAFELTKQAFEVDDWTALIFDSSRGAFAGMRAIQDLGKSIPKDVSVIAGDYDPIFAYATPSLCGIKHDYDAMLVKALEIFQAENPGKRRQHTAPALAAGESVTRSSSS